MKVAFVVHKLADRSGGAERVLIETANALSARGHDVSIVIHEARKKAPFYPLDFGVRLVNVYRFKESQSLARRTWSNCKTFVLSLLPFLPGLRILQWQNTHRPFVKALRQYFGANQADVAVAFMPPAITAAAFALKGRVPVFGSLHNDPRQEFENPERWDPNPYDRIQRRRAIALCDRVSVLLPSYVDYFPEDLREKICAVPNAIPSYPEVEFERREKVVLAVGRLSPVKRHDLLIRAWGSIWRDIPEWRLHIYGVGPERARLQEKIEKAELNGRIVLKGHTKAIGEVYASASVLAHPAEYEGFPLAVSEALASGLPVVGFGDCTGLNSLVKDGDSGILVDGRDDREAAFANALRSILLDADQRKRMSMIAPSTVAAYRPDRIIALMEKELETCISAATSDVNGLESQDGHGVLDWSPALAGAGQREAGSP